MIYAHSYSHHYTCLLWILLHSQRGVDEFVALAEKEHFVLEALGRDDTEAACWPNE